MSEQVMNEIVDNYASEIDFEHERFRAQHKRYLLDDPTGFKMAISKLLRSMEWTWKKSQNIRIYYFIGGEEE